MLETYWKACAVCLLLFLAGCAQPGAPSPDDPAKTPKNTPADVEWRQARIFPAGQSHQIDLETVPQDAILRIGVRAKVVKPPGNPNIQVEILLDNQLAESFQVPAEGKWHDRRIDLTAREPAGKTCAVRLRADSEISLAPCEFARPAPGKPNILLVLIDTLRLDHLGCYYYPLKTSPHIDALAEQSMKFWNLTPQSSWTRPSVASLLTSTYPNTHGVFDKLDCLRSGLPSLAQALAQSGYETHGLMTNVNCLPPWGFGLDFSRYADANTFKGGGDEVAIDMAIATLAHAAGRPWFMFVHLISPHDPYSAPEPYREQFMPASFVGTRPQIRIQRALALYDGEIAYVDAQVGRLFDAMKERGVYDNTLIILLADHGEQFMEHGGQGHGISLYEEELRVPLLIKMPGNSAIGESKEIVEMVDIGPTLLDVLGLPPETGFEGRSFRTLIDKSGSFEESTAYSCLRLYSTSLRMAKTREQKYLYDVVAKAPSWFDLLNDPKEFRPSRVALPGAEHLEPHAIAKSITGAAGLHLIITSGTEIGGQITGTITAPNFGDCEIECAGMDGRAVRTENGFEFAISLFHTRPEHANFVRIHGRSLQNTAHLRFDIADSPTLSAVLLWNDKPLPEGTGWMGHAMTPVPLNGESLETAALQAPLDAFDPAGLPVRLSAYLWYVAPSASLQEESLSPEIRDGLKALGYLQ